VKRFIDISIAATLLVLFSPLLVLLAIAVKLSSNGPVFFSQERVGRAFRRFRIYKFRSMRVNSSGPSVTAATDPRITAVGRLLRTAKLDELPQLWNVLKGDMSLVGPRPEVPQYVKAFEDRYRNILQVRPGITDLASLRFYNEEGYLAAAADPLQTYRDVVLPLKLDLADEYLRTHDTLLDFLILWRTLLRCVTPGEYRDAYRPIPPSLS
jgi:lipopolysaccharide/colanic/teichoic acid biosynthesis glycosyltransferase